MSKFTPSFIPGKTLIEVGRKCFDDREIKLATKALNEHWWSKGKYVSLFEKRFAKWLNAKHAITCNSGSSALLLATSALTSSSLGKHQLKSGDEVITVAAGFPTTVNPIIQNNLVPVFVDVDLHTLNIDVSSLEKAKTSKTKAVVLAHTIGNPFNLAVITKFCRLNKLFLIEDVCDSLGSKYKKKYVGTFGHLSCFSFYPAHHMTMGEGGAVVTNSAKFNQIVRSLRDWGRYLDKPIKHKGKLPKDYDQRYTFYELGFNLNITEMQAAIGLEQLKKLKKHTCLHIQNAKYLTNNLSNLPHLIIHQATKFSTPSWFGFPITVNPKAPFTRQQIIKYLNAHKIDTRLLLAGNITRQPYFHLNKINHRLIGKLSNTDIIMKNTFWIGCGPSLNLLMLDYVIKTITDFTNQYENKK